MLRTLSIRDVVLIDRLELTFRPGLSVLTGETGAGKSILLDALGLALGARGDAALIRHGADQAVVSAAFDVAPQHLARALAKDQGLDVADDDLVVRRVLSRDGRSRAFVNDQPASVTLLRQLGAALVEIEGQFAEQGLLDARTHRATLDSFAGIEAEALAVRSGFSAWREAEAALEAEESMIARLRDEEAALRLALGEIEALDPKADEEDGLAAERGLLMNREQLVEAVNATLDRLGSGGERAGADEAIRQAERALSQVAAKAAGRQDEMKFIGIDALPGPEGGIQEVIQGRLAATFVYPTCGKEAIETAHKILLNQPVPRRITLKTALITKENAEEFLRKLD